MHRDMSGSSMEVQAKYYTVDQKFISVDAEK